VRAGEIEAWARDVMERVDCRQPIEDMRVELKAAWPDPVKAARRLAAHGNAARGDSLLWLIGVNEAHGVTGASFEELSTWHAKLKREFDELSPDMTPLNVSPPRGTVVALLFETSRAPFVVKNPEGGAVQFEVPWRDGNSTQFGFGLDSGKSPGIHWWRLREGPRSLTQPPTSSGKDEDRQE